MSFVKKRVRSLNWDETEKQLLMSIIQEFSAIIENKILNTNTNKKKAEAWQQICERFNEINSHSRELCQLQLQWKQLKMSAKKSCSSTKKALFVTGGGPKQPSPTPEDPKIVDLLNPGELMVDHNTYYCDSVIDIPKMTEMETISTTISEPANIEEPTVSIMEDSVTFTPQKSSSENASVMFSANSKKKRQHTTASSCKYQTQMLQHSERLKEAEHQLRLQIMKEQHEIHMQIEEINKKRAGEELQITLQRKEHEKFVQRKEKLNEN